MSWQGRPNRQHMTPALGATDDVKAVKAAHCRQMDAGRGQQLKKHNNYLEELPGILIPPTRCIELISS
jgi:hypothetical protein